MVSLCCLDLENGDPMFEDTTWKLRQTEDGTLSGPRSLSSTASKPSGSGAEVTLEGARSAMKRATRVMDLDSMVVGGEEDEVVDEWDE